MDNSLEKPVVENATPRRRSSRPAILIIAILLIAGIGVFVFALNQHHSNKASSTSEPTSQPEHKDESPEEEPEDTPEEPADTPEEEPEDIVEGKTPVNQDGNGANSEGTLTGVINYAASDGETLAIRVSIDQYLETGECLLELTSATDSFSLADQVAPSAATSTCSYDIATSLLEEGTTYDIKISITSGNKNGIIKGEVDV